ncbi:WD40/YVTN repeat-like-containing domain superfamily protein [Pleurotus pulmonarius]
MASNQRDDNNDFDEEEQYIEADEVLAEVPDTEDRPMDEDDEDDEIGDLPGTTRIGTNCIQHFESHTGSVFCVAAHPTQPLAATGGEDDLGYIWNTSNGEVVAKLTGHTDSVTSIGFSHDGEMLSTGGMDGKVRIWRRVGKEHWKTWEFLTELQGPDEVMFLRWHPKGNVLLAGSQDATVWLWQLPSGNTMQVLSGHSGPVQCGEFTPDGKRILTACAGGDLIYWDPRSDTPIFKRQSSEGKFSVEEVTSLAINPSSTIVVVGGSNGLARIVSLVKGDVVATLTGHSNEDSVESMAFVDLSGTSNGPLVLITGTLKHEETVTAILPLAAPKSYYVVTASTDGNLRTWDARTSTQLCEHLGHQGPVLGAALGVNGTVVSAGDDGLCFVFSAENPEAGDGAMQTD